MQFGGQRQYQPVWRPAPGRRGTSFPSGHVATAFSLGSPALLTAHPAARAAIIAGSLVYGCLMGMARMAQGAHFASDVAWSATFAWVAILLSARLTLERRPPSSPEE
ncbi:MAG: phosphatase PAP2 family protein [Candidatus Eisenbacteria bacterium]|nr:phosphatase PAP2 family protein [Candidatus Eisenbacteria bacterium]